MVSHFRITEKLGEGGMGVVYKARDTQLDRFIALKFFPSSSTPSEKDKQRFIREAKAAAALNHPNICTIHNVQEFENRQYLVMEYIEGETLRAKIESGEITLDKALQFSKQIAKALAAAHRQNIIHRDIKPENIMVDNEGRIKVMDFGLAKFKQSDDITKTGDTVGTTAYMSPEQLKGEPVDQRSDIWSLGIVLFELFTGRKPFLSDYPHAVIYSILNEEPDSIFKINPDLPSELKPVIQKALAKNVKDRYQSADNLLQDLNKLSLKPVKESRQVKAADTYSQSGNRLLAPVPLTLCTALLIAVIGFFLIRPVNNIAFKQRDWLMIADFSNQTDEKEFSGFLNIILEVGLSQSAYINIYERNQTMDILRNELENRNVKTLTPEAVAKAAQHKNVQIILTPVIKKANDGYQLTATFRDIKSNTAIEIAPVKFSNKDKILPAMDTFSREIRRVLGEPPSSISEKYKPIVQATTSSLEALKLYAEGSKMKLTDINTGYDLIEQSVELDSTFALAHADLGMHYYIQNQRQKGERHFQKALQQMDRLTLRERLWIRAVVADWRGSRDKAVENYKSYLTQYPDDYYAWWRLGYTYLITGHYDNCIDAYSRVIEIDPRQSASFINLATCYKASGEKELALQYYENGFSISPEEKKGIFTNNEYGFLLVEMDSLNKARETFQLMISDDDTKARGLRSLALLNAYTGNFSQAIDYLKEAILLNKARNIYLSEYRDRLILALIYNFIGQEKYFNQEFTEIELLMAKMDLSPTWLSMAGTLYARNGMVDRAEQILDQIEKNIGNIVASSGVDRNLSEDQAFYHLVQGEISLARENYQKAIESLHLANNITDMPEPLAYCYYKAGNLEKSLEYYRKVIDEKSINTEKQFLWILAHYHIGKIFEESGKAEEAISYYEQFTELWKDSDRELPVLKDAANRLQRLKNL